MAGREVINDPRLPIVQRFSHAIRVGSTMYVSGQRGIDPQTGKVTAGGVAQQTRQALRNLVAILEVGRMTVKDVVKCTVYITNKYDFDAMNAEYRKVFSSEPPAMTVVAVDWLHEDSLVEIEAIAVDARRTACFITLRAHL
ncbi:2-iminobutanoate/2-iminopropanoate deaminase-like [Amblyomma americanum]